MSVLDAARRLEAALEELARALVAVSPDLALRAEETLATAVTAFVTARREVPGDPDTLRQALGAVRDAVTRCQALGRSTEALTRLVSPQPAYGRRGVPLPVTPPRRRRASVI
jgi:hypothetical protein